MQVCKVCAHPDRPAIEADILLGTSNPAVAGAWGLSKDSVRRHKNAGHLTAVSATAEITDAAQTARERLEFLWDRTKAILAVAEQEGAGGMALGAIKELRGMVELLAKLTGELDDSPKVQVLNVATSTEWLAIRDAMLSALIPYPEAAQAVGQRLLLLEQGGGS